MSEFHIRVVSIGLITKHPNADTLSITHVYDGYPCIFKTGDFKEGDLAVYIPINSVLPNTKPFSFLTSKERKRLKAKKLCGLFSMGILVPAPDNVEEGNNVQDLFGIKKWEPDIRAFTGGQCEAPPKGWQIPIYTDIEGLRRWPHILQEGEEVIITEKIHGANARYIHDGERLWCCSRTQIKKEAENNLWWKAARQAELAQKLIHYPKMVFFGEVYGQVQDLKYNHNHDDEPSFIVFDIFSIENKSYLNHDEAVEIVNKLNLQWVPILYRGGWDLSLVHYAEGKSMLGDNVREGFVVRPTQKRFIRGVGRVIFKMHGQGYLLRKF